MAPCWRILHVLREDAKKGQLSVRMIRDLPMLAGLDEEKVLAALDYMPKDDDIILCSYPKTGTTWMTYIIWQILNKGSALPDLREMQVNCVHNIEIHGTEPVEALTAPRFYKTHMPYNKMKTNTNAKYIYIHRNPMDTLVSFYHYLNKHAPFVKLDDVFSDFMSGTIIFGDYFDHVKSFYSHKEDKNILIVSYEDLHRDKKSSILVLAKFLGDKYYQVLAGDQDFMQKILTETEIGYMKAHLDTPFLLETAGSVENLNAGLFRKGVVGDGKNDLSSEQLKMLNNKMLGKMENTPFVEMWA